jgi:hypothetical protein
MLEYYADVYADVCVQEATIPLLLSNKDAVVQAPTGTIFFKKKRLLSSSPSTSLSTKSSYYLI